MNPEIEVPIIGPSIKEVTISKWLKPHLADVKKDEPICEIVSLNGTQTLLAESDGILVRLKQVGSILKIGSVVAFIDTNSKKGNTKGERSEFQKLTDNIIRDSKLPETLLKAEIERPMESGTSNFFASRNHISGFPYKEDLPASYPINKFPFFIGHGEQENHLGRIWTIHECLRFYYKDNIIFNIIDKTPLIGVSIFIFLWLQIIILFNIDESSYFESSLWSVQIVSNIFLTVYTIFRIYFTIKEITINNRLLVTKLLLGIACQDWLINLYAMIASRERTKTEESLKKDLIDFVFKSNISGSPETLFLYSKIRDLCNMADIEFDNLIISNFGSHEMVFRKAGVKTKYF